MNGEGDAADPQGEDQNMPGEEEPEASLDTYELAIAEAANKLSPHEGGEDEISEPEEEEGDEPRSS